MATIFNFIKNKTQQQKENDLVFEIVTNISSIGEPTEVVVGIPDKNVIFAIFLNTGRNLVIRDINVLLSKNMIVKFNKSTGYYVYSNKSFTPDNNYDIPGNSGGSFPYPAKKLYNIEENLDLIENTKDSKSKDCKLPYTFGIEYETSAGFIPSDLCLKNKMIPLKDGSISGLEYTTGIMSLDKDIDILKNQLNLLREYTLCNKECSMHIHFGGFPVDPQYLYIVSYLCRIFETQLESLAGKWCLTTSKFKKSGKDYSKPLPSFQDFNDLYRFVSDGTANYMGDLTQSHPKDPSKTQKWNINSRYSWLNFVNACFYKDAKTLEFRFLRPTLNYKKIIYWIYILGGILKCAEYIYNNFFKGKKENVTKEMLSYMIRVDVIDLLCAVYGADITIMLNQLSRYLKFQEEKLGDYIGDNETLIDKFITHDLYEVMKNSKEISVDSFIEKTGIRKYVAPKPSTKKTAVDTDAEIEALLDEIFGPENGAQAEAAR